MLFAYASVAGHLFISLFITDAHCSISHDTSCEVRHAADASGAHVDMCLSVCSSNRKGESDQVRLNDARVTHFSAGREGRPCAAALSALMAMPLR